MMSAIYYYNSFILTSVVFSYLILFDIREHYSIPISSDIGIVDTISSFCYQHIGYATVYVNIGKNKLNDKEGQC